MHATCAGGLKFKSWAAKSGTVLSTVCHHFDFYASSYAAELALAVGIMSRRWAPLTHYIHQHKLASITSFENTARAEILHLANLRKFQSENHFDMHKIC